MASGKDKYTTRVAARENREWQWGVEGAVSHVSLVMRVDVGCIDAVTTDRKGRCYPHH